MTHKLARHRELCLALCGWAALSAACSESEPAAETAPPSGAGAVATEPSGPDAATMAETTAGVAGRARGARSPASAPRPAGATRGAAGASTSSNVEGQAGRGGTPSASALAGAAASSAGSRAASSGASGVAGAVVSQAGESAAGEGGSGAGSPVPAAGAGGMGPAMTPSTRRIAFLGDSITETSCTSQLVFDALRAEGRTDFDLVGTKQNQQSCGVADPDRDVEGHSGYLVTEIVGNGPKAAELPMWCAADRADVVLMHFGTNDAWNSGVPIMDIVSAYSQVLAALRAGQPRVILLAAQIIPLSPDNCADCERRVTELNSMIPMWAASESTAESPIYVVDQWTGFDPGSDAYDRIHPNMQGSQKMADVWLAALRAHNIF